MTQPEDVIVGRSAEEIEAESGNRVNSSKTTEERQADELGTVLTPTASGPLGSQSGTALAGLPGVFGTEVRGEGVDTEASTRDVDRDSSEE